MDIVSNLNKIKNSLPNGVSLVAVSKTHPIEAIKELLPYHNIFGENKVQELTTKYDALPKTIEWHFIGHLQSNKVKYIAPFVSLIHAVDKFKLLEEINKQAIKNNRIINCLLQVHIAKEETKFGFNEEEIIEMLNSLDFQNLKNVNICGLMGMATYTEDLNEVDNEFKYLNTLYVKLKNNHFQNSNYFNQLSMGMSNDYNIAINNGSTLIRVGSSIFGER